MSSDDMEMLCMLQCKKEIFLKKHYDLHVECHHTETRLSRVHTVAKPHKQVLFQSNKISMLTTRTDSDIIGNHGFPLQEQALENCEDALPVPLLMCRGFLFYFNSKPQFHITYKLGDLGFVSQVLRTKRMSNLSACLLNVILKDFLIEYRLTTMKQQQQKPRTCQHLC